jgi:hypothetical protein
MNKSRIRELMPEGYIAKIAEQTGQTNPGNISQMVRLEQVTNKHWPVVERVAQENDPQGFAAWKGSRCAGRNDIGPR